MNKILVLAPHTDDGELGCGGTLNKWVNEGKEIIYYAFSAAEESVPEGFPKDALRKEVLHATKILGIPENNVIVDKYPVRRLNEYRQDILEKLVQLNKQYNPDIIMIPSGKDVHQDHNVIFNEGIRAFKNQSILAYELPWNNLSFDNDCFIELSEDNVNVKINALSEYKTQGHRDYLSESFIKGWANYRGVQVKKKYAECFEVIRWIM